MTQASIEELSARMKTAAATMSIRAEDNGRLEDNIDMDVTGRMDVYKNPPDRQPETLNAKWGDKPIPNVLNHRGDYGDGTVREADDVRHGVLGRAFSGMGQARDAQRKELADILTHGASGQFESRSTLLGKEKRAEAHVHDEGSLTERVRSVTGGR